MTNTRALAFWAIGAVCVFFGAPIAGNIEPEVLGATTPSVILSYIVAFILILIGGMFWITTSVVHVEEY